MTTTPEADAENLSFSPTPDDLMAAVMAQPEQIRDGILWRAAALTERRRSLELQQVVQALQGGQEAAVADQPPQHPSED